MPSASSPTLAFDLRFQDLYEREGLERIDATFMGILGESDAALRDRLLQARASAATLEAKVEAELLMAVAPHLDRFIARLFDIEDAWNELFESHHRLGPL